MKVFNVARILAITADKGGFTVNQPEDGFIVGDSQYSHVGPMTETSAAIVAIQKLGRFILKSGTHDSLGTWLDGDTLHVDPVTFVLDQTQAEELGRQRGEIAIWDVKNNRAIYL